MEQQQTTNSSLPHSFLPSRMGLVGILAVVVVATGAGLGYMLSRGKVLGGGITTRVAPGARVSRNEAGLADERTFRDSAQGTLENGGIQGEGTHHLTRPGGDSQNVYLTSSVIDLNDFVGKKVEVWGETFKGQKAGWLMDVGRIKIVE